MESAFASSAASERFERFQCVISTGIGAFREHPCALTAMALSIHDEETRLTSPRTNCPPHCGVNLPALSEPSVS